MINTHHRPGDNYKTYCLSNGLKIFLNKVPYLKSTELILSVKGGPLFENDTYAGAHHLLEHVVTRRTKKYPSKYKIQDTMDNIGVSCNFRTSCENVYYSFQMLNEYFYKVVDVASEIAKNSLLNQRDINYEKNIIHEEIARSTDDTKRFAFHNLLPKVTYSLRNEWQVALGTEESLKNLDYKYISHIYKKTHTARNTIIVVTSALSEKEIMEEINKNFGDYKRGKENRAKIEKATPSKILFDRRKTQQVKIGLGIETFQYNDERRAPLLILMSILHNKLQERLRRELGLIYSVYSWERADKYTGGLFLGTETQKEKVTNVLVETLDVLTNLSSHIKDDEFNIARDKEKAKVIFFGDNSFRTSQKYAREWQDFGRIRSISQEVTELDNVNLQNVQEIANNILKKDDFGYVFVGDIDDNLERNVKYLI